MPPILRHGALAALLAALLFGISTPLVKILVGGIAPLMLAGLLYAGSGIGLALYRSAHRLAAGGSSSGFPIRREDRLWLAGAIVFGGILGPVLLTSGLITSAASTASLLLNLEVVFTALLAWFLFGENASQRVVLGLAGIVAGGVLLGWSTGRSGQASSGPVLVTLASLCWAIDNNLTRKVALNDATLIATLKGLVAAAVNLSLAFLLGQALPPLGPLVLAMSVGLLGYGVSLVLFVLALRQLGSARTGAYFSVAPFFGAALALLLQGDPVSPRLAGAGLLMAVGVWLHLSERHGHHHVHEAQEHAHEHEHDEHHLHSHDFEWKGSSSHSHAHVHLPLMHTHAHQPDAHHRHRH
jgi:drug/metabolite transporter (DMT)-like permease